jgi:HEAT repeat protein
VQGDHKSLIEIVKTESDPSLRKKALESLALVGSPEATDYLLSLLEEDGGKDGGR